MPVAEGVTLDDVARETSDMSRFVNFYQGLFGFKETASFEIEGTKEKGIETFFTGNTLTDERAKRHSSSTLMVIYWKSRAPPVDGE
ncbi:hypothetical protein CICLE_v10006811mg [Citrus x clementina]|uniref:Glyoxalase/fosfomycin resistance/dioxygenase domain-containing protein n=1 Tax=Citrus clementina TaxID=85681 RepID=V4RGX8_CITCL|nr:hypothetical protein CICLE_v10006811mg [Citrus x clementina]